MSRFFTKVDGAVPQNHLVSILDTKKKDFLEDWKTLDAVQTVRS